MSFLDIMTLLGSFAVIILVILFTYYASRWYARKAVSSSSKYVKVIDRAALSQGSAVCIVEIGEKYYLLGVSEKNIQLLSELDDFTPPPPGEDGAKLPFQKVLSDLMAKAKREKRKDNGRPQG